MNNFAVFILTHKRADNIKTLKMLKKNGYTGNIYLVVDDEDDTVEDYRKGYGDSVVVFSKEQAATITDTVDNESGRRGVVYARNWVWQIARDLGVEYFLVLDDDYVDIRHKYENDGMLKEKSCLKLDELFASFVQFLKVSGANTVALAQNGDFVGGKDGFFKKGLARKAMNSFFCATDRPFEFKGRINEDVNAYVSLGMRGELFLTLTNISIVQTQTQSQAGGLTEIYLDTGTYIKSFYSVIVAPSCVKVAEMGNKYRRLHHKISWNYCTPKILNERHRKGG